MAKRPTQKQMLERVYLDVDFITNKMSVNGSIGIHGILKDHHNAIQSLKDGVGQSNKDIAVLMEVTEKDRLRFDLTKKFREYRKISPFWGAVKSVVTSREFIIILIGLLSMLLGITDSWHHIREIFIG